MNVTGEHTLIVKYELAETSMLLLFISRAGAVLLVSICWGLTTPNTCEPCEHQFSLCESVVHARTAIVSKCRCLMSNVSQSLGLARMTVGPTCTCVHLHVASHSSTRVLMHVHLCMHVSRACRPLRRYKGQVYIQ